ncbi:MAG: hypothetical protein RMJ81_01470 [Candidatus Kryptonium sp.]|nr:hypothetical protein [Candidatus Kryptonium sp.]MDW8108305.1 hypothetical protein [Candidatus Kryptonium sp.]
MRALILQIGLLLFFVSIITLWLQGIDIIIAVARSFVLFVAVTGLLSLVMYLFVFLKKSEKKEEISTQEASKN